MNRKIWAATLILVLTVTVVTGFAQAKKGEKPEKAKDPVCGLMVEKDPKLSNSYKGETFYFCSKADLEEFKKNPEKYVKK